MRVRLGVLEAKMPRPCASGKLATCGDLGKQQIYGFPYTVYDETSAHTAYRL